MALDPKLSCGRRVLAVAATSRLFVNPTLGLGAGGRGHCISGSVPYLVRLRLLRFPCTEAVSSAFCCTLRNTPLLTVSVSLHGLSLQCRSRQLHSKSTQLKPPRPRPAQGHLGWQLATGSHQRPTPSQLSSPLSPRLVPPTQLHRVYPTTASAPCGSYNRCTYWSCHDLGTGGSPDRRHPRSGAPAPLGVGAELVGPTDDLALEQLVDQLLPAAQATALRLTVLGGLWLRAAAEQLQFSAMSVQRAQKKALEALRQQLGA